MSARKFLATLLVAVCLSVAAPGPGWGGGSDVVITNPNGGHHLTANPAIRGERRIDAGRGSAPAAQQSWLTWVWNMLAALYGQYLRNPDPTSTP